MATATTLPTLGAAAPSRPKGPPAAVVPEWSARRVFAFMAMVFGMFMSILDIQIVSASLSEIQAGLSASADEIAWVQTSYLIAEVIMIPLSGYLSRALSTRYTFVVSAAGFTLMSFLCATSSSLNEMIIWRGLQGFIGGAMIPTVFASAYTIFPRNKLSVVTPIIGLVATLAPTIGPTVGGYLTDLFSWHWLFLVNIIPGIGVTIATWLLVDFDEPDLSLLKNFDWTGLLSMAAFLGALEYVLEEGPTKGWFDDNLVFSCAIISSIGGVVFFYRVLTTRNPIVDLSAMLDRNFWTGSILSVVLGSGLYGLTYLYPVYLATVRGYSALQIGETMAITGICMFISAPIVGRLVTKIDPRLMIGAGFIGFALGAWQASHITTDWDFNELLVPQMLRGFSLMLCMVPINNLALGTLSPARIKNASGIFNLTRNLGGAIGLAAINTLLDDRLDLHLQRLHEDVNWANAEAVSQLQMMTQNFASLGSNAALAATQALSERVRQQAFVMSIGDVFYAVAIVFSVLVFVTLLMRRPQARGAPAGGH